MSNQVLLWGTLIIPWLTLFFMKKEDIKRFMPLALFTLTIIVIIIQFGVSTGLWVIRESTFPLVKIPTYVYGVYPVGAMWIFKFTYGRFWRYLAAEVVINFILCYFALPYLDTRGILVFRTSFITFWIVTAAGMLLYIYQMWQEDTLAPVEGYRFSMEPELAAARKPLSKDEENKDDKDKQ